VRTGSALCAFALLIVGGLMGQLFLTQCLIREAFSALSLDSWLGLLLPLPYGRLQGQGLMDEFSTPLPLHLCLFVIAVPEKLSPQTRSEKTKDGAGKSKHAQSTRMPAPKTHKTAQARQSRD